MLETKILIGDVVELSPAKLSTVDDLDLEKCTVLKMEDDGSRIMVVFNNNNEQNETFFDNNSTVDWFSTRHVIDVERDFKIIEILDTQNLNTNQAATLVTMARINKQVQRTTKGVKIMGEVKEEYTEKFLFIGLGYDDFEPYFGTTNRISFSNYRAVNVTIEGKEVKVWQPRKNIADTVDLFTMQDVA